MLDPDHFESDRPGRAFFPRAKRFLSLDRPKTSPSHTTEPSSRNWARHERNFIASRRRDAGVHHDEPSVGIALSGGGIRSASFALGVLHVLEQSGFMPRVDYMSSVSGGGYAASAFLHAPPKASNESASTRAELIRNRLLNTEGYLELGGLHYATMTVVAIACALLTISPAVIVSLLLTGGPQQNTRGALLSASMVGGVAAITALIGTARTAWQRRRGIDAHSESSFWFWLTVTYSAQAVLGALGTLHWLTTFWVVVVMTLAGIGITGNLLRTPRNKAIRDSQTTAKVLAFTIFSYGVAVIKPSVLLLPHKAPIVIGICFWIAPFLMLLPWLNANRLNIAAHFYRRSIARNFLLRTEPLSVQSEPQVAGAPLHFINCLMHATLHALPDSHERGGANFFVSPLMSGSTDTGIYRTDSWKMADGKASPHLDVATLTATSGAALDGHPIRHSPIISVALLMLNLGLGQWVINPSTPKSVRKGRASLLNNFGAAIGSRSAKSSWLRLSDGGHFENLGLYELVRRECKTVLVIDGAHDAKFVFADLARAAALCQMDFGAEIVIPDLGADKKIDKHRCIYDGFIRYKGGATGKLKYIKLAVGDPHPLHLRLRSSTDKHFPHEPTVRQHVTRDFIRAYFQTGVHAALAADLAHLGK